MLRLMRFATGGDMTVDSEPELSRALYIDWFIFGWRAKRFRVGVLRVVLTDKMRHIVAMNTGKFIGDRQRRIGEQLMDKHKVWSQDKRRYTHDVEADKLPAG